MDYYTALASQPDKLRQSALRVGAALGSSDLEPWRKGTLAVASMGASSAASNAFVDRLARHGRRSMNVDASSLMFAPYNDLADSYIFVSERGRSQETRNAAARMPSGCRLGLTNDPVSPLTEVVDVVVSMEHGEDSTVSTVGYTATLQAFGLLARALDGTDEGEDWAALPGQIGETIAACTPVICELAGMFSAVSSLDFVGRAASGASACESALLVRESTRIATTAYETYQYLHGPMESLAPDRGCVLFGSEREVGLAKYIANSGVPTALVTTADVVPDGKVTVVKVPRSAPMSRAILEILPVQVLAGELAHQRGLRGCRECFTSAFMW